jgi:hypothetical protein
MTRVIQSKEEKEIDRSTSKSAGGGSLSCSRPDRICRADNFINNSKSRPGVISFVDNNKFMAIGQIASAS